MKEKYHLLISKLLDYKLLLSCEKKNFPAGHLIFTINLTYPHLGEQVGERSKLGLELYCSLSFEDKK